MGTNRPTLELKINCPQNNQDDADQTTDDQFQDDCQSWLCCSARSPHPARAPLKLPFKSSCPWSARGSWSFGTWVHLLPRTAGFLNTTTFPFTQGILSTGLLSQEQLNPSSVTRCLWRNNHSVAARAPHGVPAPSLSPSCLYTFLSV